MVSKTAFRIIEKAVGIRVSRGEDTLENIVKLYDKLSNEQAQEILNFYKPKEE